MKITAIWYRTKDWWKRLEGYQRVSLIFDLVIVLATTCYAVIAGFQFHAMSKTLNETKKIANSTIIQARSAQAQLHEMIKTSELAKQSFDFTREIVERPYVVLESMDPVDFAQEKVPTFIQRFRNEGRTPASRISGNVTLGFRPIGLEKNLKFDPIGNFSMPTMAASTSRIHYSTFKELKISKELLADLNSGKRKFYVFGFIEYEDGAGKRYPRRQFCVFYSPTPNRPSSLSLFDYCEDHNN